MDSKTFRKKAEKIGLPVDLWFNLLLVYRKDRPACLFFGKQIDKEKRKKVLELFPFFKVYQPQNDPSSKGFIYYIDKKVIDEGLKYSDIELLQVGHILGYKCPGEMGGEINPHKFSYGRSFWINDTQFCGEVCWDNKKLDDNKIKKFQKVADDFGLEIKETKRRLLNKTYTGKNIKLIPEKFFDYLAGKTLIKKWKNFDSYDQALRSLKLKNVLPDVSTYKEGVEYYHKMYSENKGGVTAIWI